MKVQKIKLGLYDYSWIVLDNDHLPIKPITDFIRYLNNIDKSPFTVRSYAYHLKLFWEIYMRNSWFIQSRISATKPIASVDLRVQIRKYKENFSGLS